MEDDTKITLKTLTPIWTGGVNGTSDRLHLTGIIGGLRWWFEVMVRGVEGKACDPSHHTCLYNDQVSDNDLCDVCQVFGATGWARRFRMIVDDGTRPDRRYNRNPTASRSYTNQLGQTMPPPRWPLKDAPLHGHIGIRMVEIDDQFQVELIGGLLQFIADWASIGAKPQMGLGIITISPHQEAQHLIDYLSNIATTQPVQGKTLPSLQNMFFAGISADNLSINEIFNLKYDLRRRFANNQKLRHFVMGTVKGKSQGAKVMMAYPDDNNSMLRVWGWIPEEVSTCGMDREQVLGKIHDHLEHTYGKNNPTY